MGSAVHYCRHRSRSLDTAIFPKHRSNGSRTNQRASGLKALSVGQAVITSTLEYEGETHTTHAVVTVTP